MTLDTLNTLDRDAFASALSGIWEHSPWIASRAWDARPFATPEELLAAMWSVVKTADSAEQMSLITAHPDLAGKLARARRLTPESALEQSEAGLDALTDDEREQLDRRNAAYREQFGFPFIICVRENSKTAILDTMDARISNPRADEIDTALEQIRRIAKFRIHDWIHS